MTSSQFTRRRRRIFPTDNSSIFLSTLFPSNDTEESFQFIDERERERERPTCDDISRKELDKRDELNDEFDEESLFYSK